MGNKQKVIDDINLLVTAMQESKYILCNKPMRNILRYIASNADLKYIVSHANNTYRFRDVLNEATANPPRFVMPTDHYKVVAMVTGLLLSIDKGEADFLYLLRNYFDGETVEEQYTDFCAQVMRAYASSFSVLISLGDNVISLDEGPKVQQTAPLQRQFTDSMYSIIRDLADKLVADNSLSDEGRRECMAILDGMQSVIGQRYNSMVSVLWIGVKHTLAMSKVCEPDLKNMAKVLSDFGYI